MTTDPSHHIFWLTSRAAGTAALLPTSPVRTPIAVSASGPTVTGRASRIRRTGRSIPNAISVVNAPPANAPP